jgi:MinD superfamily P-loop ATPase
VPEITIISGKGGTGKTSVTAAFARLASDHIVCDLDVDAPDLHLLLRPEIIESHEFHAGRTATIDPDTCILCGDCAERCRFEAIIAQPNGYIIDEHACEGCGVCAHFCPMGAVTMHERYAGNWFRSRTDVAPMIHAEMFPGAENSGLLVSTLRRAAKAESERSGRPLIIADGSPGIGCPVISSISTADFVILVTEPTPSGLHDLERAADLCARFPRPAGVIINKEGLNPAREREIADLCTARGLPLLGRIPYDKIVVDALMSGLTMADLGEHRASKAIRTAWNNVIALAVESRSVESIHS